MEPPLEVRYPRPFPQLRPRGIQAVAQSPRHVDRWFGQRDCPLIYIPFLRPQHPVPRMEWRHRVYWFAMLKQRRHLMEFWPYPGPSEEWSCEPHVVTKPFERATVDLIAEQRGVPLPVPGYLVV